MILSLFLGFLLGAGAIVFILQNDATVALTFLGWQFESSVALLVLLSILTGVVLSFLISIPRSIGVAIQMRRLRKENDALRVEAEQYRHTASEATARLNATVSDSLTRDI